MPELKAFYQPRSLSEALALLDEHGDRARPLAGGTALSVSRSARVEILVDLGRLGLDKIEEQADGLHLGAMVTCAALRRRLAGQPPALVLEAVASIGSRILQNHITVGGNCVMVYAWSDLPVAFSCAEARFVINGKNRRELGAEAFFAEHPSRLLAGGELLTEVVIPRPPAGTGSAYLKLARNSTDHALASVAATLTLDGGAIRAARLAVGAVRGLPQLLPVAAATLAGQRPAHEVLEAAARKAAEETKVTADFRAGIEYRRQLVEALVADALALAAQRAGGAA